jgi:formylglycine-generating enzyme required for sulfatase activity
MESYRLTDFKQSAPVVKSWHGLEFLRITKGPFIMGSPVDDDQIDDDEKPPHTLDIPYDYWVGRTPITNERYEAFVRDTSYQTNAEKEGWAWVWMVKEKSCEEVEGANWRHPLGSNNDLGDLANHPVVSVNFHDARAYCEWLNLQTSADLPEGYQFRLPGEAEWEKAARGPDGRLWPWGNHFEPAFCNSNEGGPDAVIAVGAHAPQSDSFYGVSDMCGNIWEWTTTLWGNERYVRAFVYPYRLGDGRDNQQEDDSYYRIIRGGSFKDNRHSLRSACRDLDPPFFSLNNLGMRVIIAPC